MNGTLYEITESYLKALDDIQIDEETGEILNAKEIVKLTDDLNQKTDSVGRYIKNLDAFTTALKDEEAKLAQRRKTAEKKLDYLKTLLTSCMDASGRDKYESAAVKISFRKSTQVNIFDEKALPEAFVTEVITTKADKTAIKKAIQSGVVVNGAELIENRNIQIK